MWAAGSRHCSRRKEHLEYMKVLCSQDVEITSKAWHWFVSRFDFFVVLANRYQSRPLEGSFNGGGAASARRILCPVSTNLSTKSSYN
jgi:hypothetical protein